MEPLTKEECAFFDLLRSGLWEKECSNNFPLLSGEQWKVIYRISQEQSVIGIVYSGITLLDPDKMPPQAILFQWVADADAIERRNKHINQVIKYIYEILTPHNIKPIVLKGQGAASAYEQPLLRSSGDIDLFFSSNKEREQAAEILANKLEIKIEHNITDSIDLTIKGVIVELHNKIFDFHTPGTKKYIRNASINPQFSVCNIDSDNQIIIPAPILQMLSINSHIAKHALSLGIGLRQICDYARSCYINANNIDKHLYVSILKKAGLYKWNTLLQSFMTTYLGIDKKYLPIDEQCVNSDKLLNIVMSSGNFGKYHTGRQELIKANSKLRLKLNTAKQMLNCALFALSIAPREAICNTMNIITKTALNYVHK